MYLMLTFTYFVTLLCQSTCLPNNIDGVEWYDIGQNEESLTQYTYLESELIYTSQDGGFLEGPVWIPDDSDIYSKDNGYLVYVELLTGKLMKLYYNQTLNKYTSDVLVDLSLIGYGSSCGVGYHSECSLKNTIAIAVWDIFDYGSILTYDLKANRLTRIYDELIVNNEVLHKFGALNDVVMDSECNIYFSEFTVGADAASIKQPAGYDGIYSINLITREMGIVENGIYGANGIGLSNDGESLMIGNCKSQNVFTFGDFASFGEESMFDKFRYDQLYWKQYFRTRNNQDTSSSSSSSGSSSGGKFSMSSSSIYLNASDYHSINDEIYKVSLNNGTTLDNVNNKIDIFRPGISDGLIQDEYENWWFTHLGPNHSRIIIANKNGKIFGIIAKSLENSVIPGTFSNLFLGNNNNAIYVTGGVFDPTMTVVSGWIIKIYVRPKNSVIDSKENVQHWLHPSILETRRSTVNIKSDIIEQCGKEFAAQGSCRIDNFLNENVLSKMINEFHNTDKARFNESTTVFVQPKDLENYDSNHGKNIESLFSYVFVDKFALGLRSNSVSLYFQDWFVSLLSQIYFNNLNSNSNSDYHLYRSHDYNRSAFGTYNLNNDFAGWHYDEHPFSSLIMLQAPQNGGVFEYYHNSRIKNNDKQTYENIKKIVNTPENERLKRNLQTCGEEKEGDGECREGEGEGLRFVRIIPRNNTMYLFHGNASLHRVTTVEGNQARIAAAYVWSDQPFFKHSSYFKEMVFDKEEQQSQCQLTGNQDSDCV